MTNLIMHLVKKLPITLTVILAGLIHSQTLAQTVQAPSCAAVFSGPTQSFSRATQATVSIKNSAQILSSQPGFNGELSFQRMIGNPRANSCGDGIRCQVNGQAAESVNLPPFKVSNTNISQRFQGEVTLGMATNHYGLVQIDANAAPATVIDFSLSHEDYFFSGLTLKGNTQLLLNAGQSYWFNQFSLEDDVVIRVVGNGSANVYINQTVNINSNGLINPDSASKLHIWMYNSNQGNSSAKITNSQINASVYVAGRLELIGDANINGSVTVTALDIRQNSTIKYDEAVLDSSDWDDLCDADPNQLVGFEIIDHNDDGQGFMCALESITIRAVDAAGNTLTNYTGQIQLDVGSGIGNWFKGFAANDLVNAADGFGHAEYQFSAADQGEIQLSLLHDQQQSTQIIVTDDVVQSRKAMTFGLNNVDNNWLLEAGTVNLDPSFPPTTVNLKQSYPYPPIILATSENLTYRLQLARTVKINDVTQNSFTIDVYEPVYFFGIFRPRMLVSYIAIEPGIHKMPNGVTVEACLTATNRFQSRFDRQGSSTKRIKYQSAFDNTPVVVSSIQSKNQVLEDTGLPPWFTDGINSKNQNQMEVFLELSEIQDQPIEQAEIIGYVLLDAEKTGEFTDKAGEQVRFETLLSENVRGAGFVGQNCYPQQTQLQYISPPLLTATKNERKNADGGWAVRCDASDIPVSLSIEDTSFDRLHNEEELGVLIFDKPFSAEIGPDQSCDLNRFSIVQTPVALACPQDRPAVEITALCADGSIKADYAGKIQISADTSSQVGFSVYENSTDTRPLANNQYTFDGVDAGVKKLYFEYLNVADELKIKVQDIPLNLTSIAIDGTEFRASGIVTTAVDDFTCGSQPTAFSLTAIGQTEQASCQVLTGFEGDFAFKAAFTLDVDNDGSADPITTPILLNGQAISSANLPSQSNLTLSFVQGQSQINLDYLDVGRILALELQYDNPPYNAAPLYGMTDSFLVSPDHVAVSIPSEPNAFCADPSNIDNCDVFKKAGERFDLSIQAVCADANASVAENYIQSGLSLTSSLVAPITGGASDVLEDDVIDVNGTTTITRSSRDVGVFDFTLTVPNYFGVIPIADYSLPQVGRFTPDHFELAVVEHGDLESRNGCLFTYIGELSNNVGAIRYGMQAPTLAISAMNADRELTINYKDDFMRLNKDGFSYQAPEVDNSAVGVNGQGMLISAQVYIDEGSDQHAQLEAIEDGKLALTLSELDHFVYDHDASGNIQIAPFISDFDISINKVEDIDGIVHRSYSDTGAELGVQPILLSPEGIEQRLGRWAVENAYSSELVRLPVPMKVEYFNGQGYQLSQQDSCTSIDLGAVQLTSTDLDITQLGIDTQGRLQFDFGQNSAIGVTPYGVSGDARFIYRSPDWLKSNWDGSNRFDQSPSGILSFGVFRNNDRIIYKKEGTGN